VAEPCPQCGGLMVAEAPDGVACTNCPWKAEPEEAPAMAPAEPEPELAPVGD